MSNELSKAKITYDSFNTFITEVEHGLIGFECTKTEEKEYNHFLGTGIEITKSYKRNNLLFALEITCAFRVIDKPEIIYLVEATVSDTSIGRAHNVSVYREEAITSVFNDVMNGIKNEFNEKIVVFSSFEIL